MEAANFAHFGTKWRHERAANLAYDALVDSD